MKPRKNSPKRDQEIGRYKLKFIEPIFYWVRWYILLVMAGVVFSLGLYSDSLESTFKVLFLTLGVALFVWSTTFNTGVGYLVGHWFNFFADVGLVKKHNEIVYESTAEFFAYLPPLFAVLYFFIVFTTTHNYGIFLKLSIWLFMIPILLSLVMIILVPILKFVQEGAEYKKNLNKKHKKR